MRINPDHPHRVDNGYTGIAISLHWLIALAIVGSFSLGLYMHELPLSPQKLKLYSWHKWAGVTIFLFVALRLGWRLFHRPPELPATMPDWQRKVAAATHVLLYVLMFAVPLSGWLMSSAKGFQTVWFGVLPLPDFLNKSETLGDTLQQVHMLLNFSMAALVLAHVGAALKHYFIDRDDILRRMIPLLGKRQTSGVVK
ncbi:MAG: cytochrome b [Burkholderiaceae bacterium]|nr:cytochrome b [Sulfuritalea sp.]MCF8174729.1 cytochrome b [Burkholderiaceae bacterium]